MRLSRTFLLFFLLIGPIGYGQTMPGSVNGYKVHNADLVIKNGQLNSQDSSGDVEISVGLPEIVEMNISGISFDVGAEILSHRESGRVEFVFFRDFKVNGLSLDVEDYRHPFDLKKGRPLSIPKPVKVSVRLSSVPRAIFNELINTPKKLDVTGTVLIFGKFKRFGFTFKRVIPAKVKLTFDNPLRRGQPR